LGAKRGELLGERRGLSASKLMSQFEQKGKRSGKSRKKKRRKQEGKCRKVTKGEKPTAKR